MLLNILYYDQAAEAKDQATAGGLAVGPLLITPQQVCGHSYDVASGDAWLVRPCML